MIDRSIPAGLSLAYLLWVLGGTFITASFVGPIQLAAVGVFIAGVGGVTQIRCCLSAMASREREAYRMGLGHRESVRSLH